MRELRKACWLTVERKKSIMAFRKMEREAASGGEE